MVKVKYIIKNKLIDKKAFGNYLWTIIFVIIITTFSCVIIEICSTFTIVQRVKEAMVQSTLRCLTEQYDEVFSANRDSYLGGYTKNTNENIDYNNIIDDINLILGTVNNSKIRKDGKMAYRFYDFKYIIENTGYTNNSKRYKINMRLKLEIPIKFFKTNYIPVYDIAESSTYTTKY